MSSDYLDDVECNGVSVLLVMMASGFAELVILEPDMGSEIGAIAHFPLIPNKAGLANAEKIIIALKAWSEHVQTAGLMQDM